MESPEKDLSKVPALAWVASPAQARRARNARRVGLVILAVIVAAASLNLLGPRDTTARTSAGGASLEVRHHGVAREGIDTDVELEIQRDDAGPIRVELPSSAIDDLGLETFVPVPSSESVRGGSYVLTYEDMPAGSVTLRILGRMPTRVKAGLMRHDITVDVGGAEPLELTMRTWVLP